MAQTTSDLWKELLRTPGTIREYAFDINDVWYGPDSEVEHSVENELFGELAIGGANSSVLSLRIIADNIPRAATIKRYARLRNGETVSEWIPKGVFFVNRRAVDGDSWNVEAYDAMGKADTEYLSEVDEGDWPRSMKTVFEEIAAHMGVTVDARTAINEDYVLQYPTDQTEREILCQIAAAHAGNCIITDAGELYLLPLLSAPAETYSLVTQHGDAITFGGVKIRVG